jgi:hypothetical protein
MRMHPDVSPASWHKTPSDPLSSHNVHQAADFDRLHIGHGIEVLPVHVEIALIVLVFVNRRRVV